MSVKVFVDTNILVYARDTSEAEKQGIARQWMEHLWKQRTGRLSYQCFNEYYVITTQRLKPGLAQQEAREDLLALEMWNPIAVDQTVINNAWRIQGSFKFSWWDFLMISAAQIQDCAFFLSEDLPHQQEIDDLTVLNPFLSELSQVLASRVEKHARSSQA